MRLNVLILLVVFMLLGLISADVSKAKLYEWVDENGTPSFTNDPKRIPEKYRFQVFGPDSNVRPNTDQIQHSGDFRTGSELDGFRGLKWGEPFSVFSRNYEVSSFDDGKAIGGIKKYIKKGDSLRLGNAELERIVYGFWRDKFAIVFIVTFGLRNYTALKEATLARFGSNYEKRHDDVFVWKGNKTNALLGYEPLSSQGFLFVGIKELEYR